MGQLADAVASTLGATDSSYDARRAAYDLWKLRGKELVSKVANSRRCCIPPRAIRTIAALVILGEKVLRPILASVGKRKMGRKPKNWSSMDEHYEAVRQDMFTDGRPTDRRVATDKVLSMLFPQVPSAVQVWQLAWARGSPVRTGCTVRADCGRRQSFDDR